ncbi:MAG TPA: FecR domain-containing protein [Chitinophagaceae bacterium]|nr:FecR domain-containing protein [Chitinophagaceae bacterium]
MQERLHYLFEQYLENKCSRKELEEFFKYIRKAEHDEQLRQHIRNVYASIQKNSSSLTCVDENGQLILNEPNWLKPGAQVVNFKKQLARLAIAVSVAGILCTTWLILRTSPSGKKTNTVSALTKKTTDRSESKFLLLEDSTRVWLNAASSLEFPDEFNSKAREVYLSGEAYFDVKHADKIPFIIHTGNVSTTVLGTAFNIKAYPGQKNIIVSVSRGKVKVSRRNEPVITLVNGQQAKVEDRGTGIVEKVIPVTGIAAWQHGNIEYDDEAFEDIIADMERIYNTTISLQNNSIRGLKVSTSFKKEIGVEQALQILSKLTDTELKQTGNVYTIK